MTQGSFIRTELLGHVGSDIELRMAHSVPVANFRVATNYRYTTSDGEEREEVEWTSVNVWRAQAENCARYLRKGSRVYIEGRPRTRSWQDDSGQTRYRTELEAAKVIFLDGRGGAEGEVEDAVE